MDGMIEIGRIKVVRVKARDPKTKKLVPKFGPGDEPLTRVVSEEVWRETKGHLGHNYGSKERGRKLVAGLIAGDVLTLYPKGTRRAEQASLFDIYQWMIRSRVLRKQLEKARETKRARQARREAESIRRAEKRMRRTAK